MHKLNRVFNRDDMAAAVGIPVVNQRRQRRGFTRTRAADEQDQATLGHDHLGQHRRQPQVS
jgi:hypothetical protein